MSDTTRNYRPSFARSYIVTGLFVSLFPACVYHTGVETENVYVTQPDAGPTADAGTEDADMKGSSKAVVLRRGVSTIVACGNYHFFENVEKAGSHYEVEKVPQAGSYLVQFETTPNGGVVPGTNSVGQPVFPTSTYAIVRWTIGGNDIQRILSVSNGASLEGVGEGVTIQLFDATVAPAPGGDPVPLYTVTATVSPGVRGSNANPPIYSPLPSNGALTVSGGAKPSQLFPVPLQAGAVSAQVVVWGDATHPPDVAVFQLTAGGGVVRVYNPTDYPGFVPLDPTCTSLQVINGSATVQAFVGVAFGIDG